MKRFLLFLIILCCLAMTQINAQVTVGTGTNESQAVPIEPYYGYTYSQSIYLQSEINAVGSITNIAYYFSGTSTLSNTQDITVWMGLSTKADFTSTTDWVDVTTLTQVYNGALGTPSGPGWINITLDVPFAYTNATNLIVAVDENTPGYNSSGDDFYCSSVGTSRSIYYRNDSINPDPTAPPTANGSIAYIPNIQLFGLTPATPPNCDAAMTTPTDGAIDVVETSAIEWSAASGSPTGYKLQIGTTTGGSEFLVQTDVGAVTTYSPSTSFAYSTTYYVTITAYNSNGDATGCTEYSFTTRADPTIIAPHTETFSAGATPSNWLQSATTGGPWVFTGSTSNFGCSAAADHTGDSGGYAWMDQSNSDVGVILETPPFNVAALTTPYLQFYHFLCTSGYSPANETHVEAYDGSAWSSVAIINTGSGAWEEFGYDLTAFVYNTSFVKLRFRAESGGSFSDYYGDNAIDDVSVMEAPSCLNPSGMVTSNSTLTSTDLVWTAGSTETDWNLEYLGGADFTPGTGAAGVTATAVSGSPMTSLTSLTTGTTYYAYYQADCGATNGTSDWVGPFTFYIGYCIPGYTTGTAVGDLIAQVTIGVPGNTPLYTGPFDDTAGGPSYVDNTGLGSIVALDAGSSYEVGAVMSTYGQNIAAWVDFNNDGTFDTATERIGFGAVAANATGYFPISLACDVTPGTFRLRIRSDYSTAPSSIDPCATYTWGETEDYLITVNAPPPCPAVPATSLAAANVTSTAADLSWTMGCSETVWNVHITTAGGGAPTGTASHPGLTMTSLTATGLTIGQDLEFWVQADCGGGTLATWTGPFAFSTTCDASAMIVVPHGFGAQTADSECTDASGWTHYFKSTSNQVLLSIQRNGETIGTIGDGTFGVTVMANGAASYHPTATGFINNPWGGVTFDRKWDVVATAQPLSNVGVRFYFTQQNYNDLNALVTTTTGSDGNVGTDVGGRANMAFYKVKPTATEQDPFMVGNLAEADIYFIENGTSGLTGWTEGAFGSDFYAEYEVNSFSGGGGGGAASGGQPILPIELKAFFGESIENYNLLTWVSATEENTRLHVIERSADGINDFNEIGSTAAAGYSSNEIEYNLRDDNPLSLGYYRLKTIDHDGRVQYSNIIALQREVDDLQVVNTYPVPVNDKLTVDFVTAEEEEVTYTLTDLTGKILVQNTIEATKGLNQTVIDLANFSNGVYFLTMQNEATRVVKNIVKN